MTMSGFSPVLWLALGVFVGWLMFNQPACGGGASSVSAGTPTSAPAPVVVAPTTQPTGGLPSIAGGCSC